MTIRLHSDKEQLHEAYTRIYGEPCSFRAWYRWRNSTIYVSVDDLHRGMLAHEITHHLLDNYFLVRVPSPMGEAVGQFVERAVD